MVEQTTENRCVDSSILSLGTVQRHLDRLALVPERRKELGIALGGVARYTLLCARRFGSGMQSTPAEVAQW